MDLLQKCKEFLGELQETSQGTLTGLIYSILFYFISNGNPAITWLPFWKNKQPKIAKISWIDGPILQPYIETIQNYDPDKYMNPLMEPESLEEMAPQLFNIHIAMIEQIGYFYMDTMAAFATKVSPYMAAPAISHQSDCLNCSLGPVLNQTLFFCYVPGDRLQSAENTRPNIKWIFIYSLMLTLVFYHLFETFFDKIDCYICRRWSADYRQAPRNICIVNPRNQNANRHALRNPLSMNDGTYQTIGEVDSHGSQG
ncbi:uncharacterized protein LOC111065816 [Drosophila obscura]|uniref:uncharacterized protein LOC111065816 n=1 Tax=Drosophila obscura TaxID=7282 RepID=UPI001BB23F85|nr:uncharacterized protein LOC111065816 [Drosophila obscura]